VLAHAAALGPAARCAAEAAAQRSNHTTIQVIDSQTTAIGLGLLAQMAAEAAADGASIHAIEQRVRAAIPRVYMLICIPQMSCLAQAGYLSRSQAVVGEMLGLLPIFALEDGRLTPMLKVRTQRHLLESFQEFIDEFTDPYHVALIQGPTQARLHARTLHDYVAGSFPNAPFSVHPAGEFLAALFGAQCVALVVMEKVTSQ
jgi:DegV family protein with EDD domain